MIVYHYGKRIYATSLRSHLKSWWRINAFRFIALLLLNAFLGSMIYALAQEMRANSVKAVEFRIQIPRKTEEEIKIEGLRDLVLTYADIYKVDRKLVDFVISCESKWNEKQEGDFIKGIPHAFGLWQIWPEYHPDISKSCALDAKCSTEWSMKKIAQGQIKLWTCGRRYLEK